MPSPTKDAGAEIPAIRARLSHDALAATGRFHAALHNADNSLADRLVTLFRLGG